MENAREDERLNRGFGEYPRRGLDVVLWGWGERWDRRLGGEERGLRRESEICRRRGF